MSVPFQYYTQWDPNRRPSQYFLSRSGLSAALSPAWTQRWLLGPQGVGTVSEQQQFLNKVRSCIQLGDIGRLAEILNAAERSTRAGGSGGSSLFKSALLKPVASELHRQRQVRRPPRSLRR